ncbi:MAG TPA: serine hydrolase domain-containing protein [Thermoanaerobaculia bacterium]|jgi:CubicO group peptidase (beta-lactamase class C family)|nr:serine hydrolase domain-containing protein [Thermoanaerobaculia bacterium]
MKTKWASLLPLLILAAAGGCLQAPGGRVPPAPDPSPARSGLAGSPAIEAGELAALLDPVFAEGMDREHIPGAVFVLVRKDKVVLERGYGVADVASRRPVLPETTQFPIASISKVFTATAVMQLADRRTVDLQADVNRYLKSVQVPPTYPQPITVAHLLTHSSGLDEIPGRRIKSEAERMPLGRFLADRLIRVHAPGEMVGYSTYGIALAGVLVEDVSGLPYEQYLTRNIWQPLGMKRTFITTPAAFVGDLATAYELNDGKAVAVPYEIYQTPPASSIVSTAADMARFMIAHLQHGRSGTARILSETAAETMHRQQATMHPRLPGWTYGFQASDTNGRRIIEHGGDIGGFSSLMVLLPDEGVGFFIASHLEGADLRFKVREKILDHYFPDTRPVKVPVARPEEAESLRRFAGVYRANAFCHSCADGGPNVQDFQVTANDDGTITVWDTRWVQVEPLFFRSPDGLRRIGFKEDASGRIIGLTAGSWRVLERIR